MLFNYRKDSRVIKNEPEKLIFLLTLTAIFSLATGYNFNTKSVKVFQDPAGFGGSRESYFGFSTALYNSGLSKDFADASILVGAPRANVSSIPSVLEPGTVYKCRINDTCVEWNLDPTKNGHINRNPNINQIKDNAWIGATIGVENKTQPRVVVCAPRWKNNIINANIPNWFMNGMCYWSLARSEETFQKQADNRMIPLLGIPLQITSSGNVRLYNYGMGQTGFSLHMHSNNIESDVILGNPGVYNWKGVPSLSIHSPDGSSRQIIPQIGNEMLIRSGDYFGYSVSSGSYFKKRERWYASGAPRGADMQGRVLIFRYSALPDKRLVVSKVLDGEQHGEYFGASLTSCDINNDGRDEIVVGAPHWSKYMDEGRVYAYVVKSNGEFESQYLEGEIIGGRFGSAVTCLGDLDYDGYGDIAVGAPYENDHGAIYVYNGNTNGLSKKYSQRIEGQSISPGIRGFGATISEPRDIDGNAYADVAIGAYLSGHVVLLRSQPVVTMRVSVTYENAKELQSNTTFFVINVCSSYEGSHVPEKLSVERILKVDVIQGRAFYGDKKNINDTYYLPDTLRRGKKSCDQLRMNLVRGIQNIIDPIELSVTLTLAESSEARLDSLQQPANENSANKFCPLCPVVNKMLSKTEDSITLPFAVDCGPDNVCTSILDLSVTGDLENGNRYTLGSKPTVKLMIGVANRGEPAYKAQAHIYVPSPISLGSLPRECMENSRIDGILEVSCEFGNPLRDRKSSILELDMSRVRSDSNEVHLLANMSTQSVNLNWATNTRNFTIYFDVDVDIAIAGKSQEALYSYLGKDEEKRLEIIRFQHIYEVQKFGKSPIEESVLTVLVPMHWNDEQGNDIEIARINQTFGLMDGRQFYCAGSSISSENNDIVDETILSDSLILKNGTKTVRPINAKNENHTFERFSIEENPTLSVPPDNRTIFLNCTNPTVKCIQISCKLGTFANSLTVAKLTITLDLQLRNFQPETMAARDIVFFVSTGSVNITQPGGIVQRVEDKPDTALVGTTFVGSPIASRIAIWIIVLSVLLGILLLVLLTLGLIKFGFFHRKKREELEALKAENDKKHGFVLETSSSREALDQD